MLGAVLFLTLNTELTYIMVVHSVVNRTLIPMLHIYKDPVSARPVHRRLVAGFINQTLLSYVVIELGDAEERHRINRLLDDNIGSGGRSISSWHRAIEHDDLLHLPRLHGAVN